jgi:hypothetical protein
VKYELYNMTESQQTILRICSERNKTEKKKESPVSCSATTHVMQVVVLNVASRCRKNGDS